MAPTLRLIVASIALTGAISSPCLGQYSVPPAKYHPKTSETARPSVALLLPGGAPAHRITLPEPTVAERESMKASNAAVDNPKRGAIKNRRLQIGFARPLAQTPGSVRLSELPWQDARNGLAAAQIRLTSPGASAIRIGLVLANAPARLRLRFASSSSATVFGPFGGSALREFPIYWSPVLEGETATVEIELPAGDSVDNATLAIPMISHLNVSGSALKQADPLQRIGRAGTCEIDVACVDETLQQQLSTATNAVARMVFVDHGATYLCTGTLVNDSVSSMTPYFYTANHCIDNGNNNPAQSRDFPAATAATINTYWFFSAEVCGVDTASGVSFVLLPGGAKLVGRSTDYDWAVVRLNSAPPAGVTFAAWNAAAPIATGTETAAIHHPVGDLKKWSQGAVRRYNTYSDGGSYIEVQWSQGVTEGGSSGSGLFVLNPAANYYELRGGLYGGSSACSPASARLLPDIYSRFDVALPHLAMFLMPDAANPRQQTLVVEYYNGQLDDYFITADAAEIADLDNAVHEGWARTGLTFLAYANPAVAPADARPVCRFYVLPAVGDSHFYSADPDECAATAARFAGSWVQESAAVFYIQLPDATGRCPANTRPVFRFLNRFNGLHHRYTAEVDVRDATIREGSWIIEGTGSPPAVMCAPTI